MKHQQSRGIPVQLLKLAWVSTLLMSCLGNPVPTTQPRARDVPQASDSQPTWPAAIERQVPAGTESSSLEGNTTKPEDAAYWPTEAWRLAAPEEQGMDAALLHQLLGAIEKQNLQVDGVVVVHKGYIVTEKYYSPYEQATPHEVYSITKSVVSALIGIAIQKGYINSVKDPVLGFFPGRTFENDSALKRSITLKHLLTMSSGLEWDWDEMVSTRDWVQYVLDQPMYTEPGTEFFYSSGNAHVLSAIIQQTSGLNTHEFAQQHLFEPLGITGTSWQKDIDGIVKGGWGLEMTPRDMAKLGYLYLKQGVWDGRQIVPASWIEATTTEYIQVPEPLETWDLHIGYLWWLHADGPYAAHGMKGQFIYVVPESDLVVVFTSDIPDAEFAQPQLLIRDHIIPACHSWPE